MPTMNGMTPALQEKLQKEMEYVQLMDSFKQYNFVAELCFNKCINGFRSKDLTEDENGCLDQCVKKFMKHSQRCGLRFAEERYMMEQQAQLQQQGGAPGSS